MIEIKEALRQWLAGAPKKRIAAQLGIDPKTVRRYIAEAERQGIRVDDGVEALTDERVSGVVVELKTPPDRTPGESWRACVDKREFIEGKLAKGVRLSKIQRLLVRQGVDVPYSTLHRFATNELGFCRRPATVPLADGAPGEEIQVDTGWMTFTTPDASGRRRKFRAFVFTPSVSRYRFVFPCLRERTDDAIEAFEAAWAFYGGVFKVAIVDNTKAIVEKADPLEPKLIEGFLEYAQARGFHIDTARVRKPTDKARVERGVRDVRDDCFGGEQLDSIEDAKARAVVWCEREYGMRRHSTTSRMPKEHFEAVEMPQLLPEPTEAYDIPIWCDPKVARDHFAQVACALYSLPTRFIGRRLRARADSKLVRFYDRGELVKTHARQPKGGRATDVSDFPQEKQAYATRDVDFLQRQATKAGDFIGAYAARLLDGPLPWTRMRQVYALLGLARRFGDARVEEACRVALAADLISVKRLRKIIEVAAPTPEPTRPESNVIHMTRYMRPAEQYALPGISTNPNNDEQERE
ncbi:MAG: IS21 family transposase [Actinomycetia bacterium]|nr:IS21 family transposase [Actinomycetes bacterium]